MKLSIFRLFGCVHGCLVRDRLDILHRSLGLVVWLLRLHAWQPFSNKKAILYHCMTPFRCVLPTLPIFYVYRACFLLWRYAVPVLRDFDLNSIYTARIIPCRSNCSRHDASWSTRNAVRSWMVSSRLVIHCMSQTVTVAQYDSRFNVFKIYFWK